MSDFIRSEHTLEDLEKFRDKDGFIDLTKAGINITKNSREKRGTAERIKNWVDFAGKKVLIRGQPDEIENYSMYAELIVEEIAKQLGIENAHYDLIKIKDENGNETFGVLSESIIDMDKEELISLHDLIGDEDAPKDEIEYITYMITTKYDFTIEKLEERLTRGGYSQDEIQGIMLDYKKRLMFSLLILDSDKHPENISFIKNINGNGGLRISPNYDSEFSLLLELDRNSCVDLLKIPFGIENEADLEEPKIGIIVKEDDGGWNSMWKDTLEKLIEDDELYDYYNDNLRGKIDIEEIFERVENRIHSKIPENVKKIAQKAYEARSETMEKIIDGTITPAHSFSEGILDKCISIGENEGITMDELINIANMMQRDIEKSRQKRDAKDDIEME